MWTHSEMFSEVHGGRKLHWGARRTWQALNKRFPGHGISFRAIEEMVSNCPICQKDRLGMDGYMWSQSIVISRRTTRAERWVWTC